MHMLFGPPEQWLCWLVVSCRVLCSPDELAGFDAPSAVSDSRSFASPPSPALSPQSGDAAPAALRGRELAQPYPFFEVTPYVNVLVFDSNDPHCDSRYESPPIYDPNIAGYPRDGTDVLRKRDMSCGVAPARFVLTTSNSADYTDPTVQARMQIRITCAIARFVESDTCENVLDATGGLPKIEGCRFMRHEARLILATRLLPQSTYSVTLKLVQPPGKNAASDNNFELTIEYYQMKVIEGTMSPIDIIHTIENAKDENRYGSNYAQRGYITSFTWQPGRDYSPTPGVKTTFTFGLRTFGVMGYHNLKYAIDVVAYPTNVWKFGTPGEGCELYSGPEVGTTCELRSFKGVLATVSNGFRITVGSTDLNNLGSNRRFSLRLHNPDHSVNMYWTATSFRLDQDQLPLEPYSVMLDKPISVLGLPTGSVAEWELASIGADQWVTLDILPGNTIVPQRTTAGILVVIPPSTFSIIESAAPQAAGPAFNSLPCEAWPEEDRRLGRWICTFQDRGPFKETRYRVRLKVRNPTVPAAARSWRVELWQTGATKPIAITRSIRGMPVSGTMTASVAPVNQLLGGSNLLTIEFTPSQDVGAVPRTRLQILAPAGFVIVKRCTGFKPVLLPACTCQGNNANGVELIFSEPDVIKAGATYSFEIQATNPTINLPDAENVWIFNTVRPDRVSKDTTTYQGFFLYPYEFSSFQVLALSRRVGPQFVILRFVPNFDIPFDDYLRFRAPTGVVWHADDLGFDSTNAATDSRTFGTAAPAVVYETPNVLIVQLTTTTLAYFEYGIRVRVMVPTVTPIPNRWWIEQYRQTGAPPPNNWRYMASMGAAGFDSQVLVQTLIQPFNIVEEAWQNPTLIAFMATVPVLPDSAITSSGVEIIPAEIFVTAPAMFTFICPLTPTIYFPPYTVSVPADVECVVNHQVESERNKLHLYFSTGLQAGVRYAFTIDVVNALYVDPTSNFFRLQTRVGGNVEEEAILDGFALSSRMDNTRFVPGQRNEDRVVEAARNRVTFIIGTIREVSFNTILEVKAPYDGVDGFRFNWDCTNDVGWAWWVPGVLELPKVELCQNLERTTQQAFNIAHIFLLEPWKLGSYSLFVIVQNPVFTPKRNFWGFTIYDQSYVPQMSEAWVHGFEIQVVVNPIFHAHIPGRGDTRESAMNIIDVTFTLTTPLEKDGFFRVTAPQGFQFPSVCRGFRPCLDCRKTLGVAVVENASPLNPFTSCSGNGVRTLTLSSFKVDLTAQTAYAFRVMVVNPDESFADSDVERWWWRFETQSAGSANPPNQLLDLNRMAPSFPVYERLRYFVVDTLSRVGLQQTTLRMHFRTTSPLPPQQTVHIYPPQGMRFGGVRSAFVTNACFDEFDEDPVIIARRFPEPLISGVTRFPEWMSCRVESEDEVVLRNEESLLGGRPLINGPVFEVFVKNVTNAQSTPYLNFFKIIAKTTTPLGKEVWAADGYVVNPELENIAIGLTNPGYGLYTQFHIEMKTITEVPSRGSIRIVAPDDYVFGPVILTPETTTDPLDPLPPPQGISPPRPPVELARIVDVFRPTDWSCPLDFQPCIVQFRPDCQENPSCTATNGANCNKWREKCDTGDLKELFTCTSYGPVIEIYFANEVVLPALQLFKFNVLGYNTRFETAAHLNTWSFMTRNSDSEKTTLDEKPGVPGSKLIGVIFVKSIVPSDTKIGVVENKVKVTLVLDVEVPPRALFRITHPTAFMRSANAAFEGSLIDTGPTFPRSMSKRQTLNIIELEAVEEAFEAGVELEVTVSLSNPLISPSMVDNVWTFETSSEESGGWTILNCNYAATGFKIYGEFASTQVTGAVLSPTAKNIVAVWFVLKSILPFSSTSRMRIWMPRGFVPKHQCGIGDFKLDYNKNREGVKNPFPAEKTYFPLPSGTECYDHIDTESGQSYISLKVDGILDYGLDYAFEFAITNPRYTPPPKENVWRYETMMNGVILHLQPEIAGFVLEQIKTVEIYPDDTTSMLRRSRITFYMMSDKYIPGGSKIIINAPDQFEFTCVKFRTDTGLAPTTTCYVVSPTRAEFTMDSEDPKKPDTPFRLYVHVSNPEFTPQVNNWQFDIVSPLGHSIDLRDKVPSFDVTGRVLVYIFPSSPYLDELNPLRVSFVPSTIMNQADDGNELVLTAPAGYRFTRNCTGFYIRLSNERDALPTDSPDYDVSSDFPPEGMGCTGYENETVVVRFPNGKGLLRNNYTLEVDVRNPGYHPNGTNEWAFITRVRNNDIGERIVDANRTLPGFTLFELSTVRHDEAQLGEPGMPTMPPGAASPRFSLCAYALMCAVGVSLQLW